MKSHLLAMALKDKRMQKMTRQVKLNVNVLPQLPLPMLEDVPE
jgi:hypothetical protein